MMSRATLFALALLLPLPAPAAPIRPRPDPVRAGIVVPHPQGVTRITWVYDGWVYFDESDGVYREPARKADVAGWLKGRHPHSVPSITTSGKSSSLSEDARTS
jgi:hypothetical protein